MFGRSEPATGPSPRTCWSTTAASAKRRRSRARSMRCFARGSALRTSRSSSSAKAARRSNAVVAAGGMESMSNAPYLLKDARGGYRFGDGRLIDAMIHDGLWDYYFPMTMAAQGARVAHELGVSREEQDRFAYESHRRALQ